MDNELTVVSIAINELELDNQNARKHNPRNINAIASSLEEFGQQKPIVVWQQKVIAGNGTLTAAQSLGWESIMISKVPDDWPYEKALAYAIADNRTADLAEWNQNQLLENLNILRDFDLQSAAGYNPLEIDDLRVAIEEIDRNLAGIPDNVLMQDRDALVQRYADRAMRAFNFDFPSHIYVWVADRLAQMRENEGLATNNDVLLSLIAQHFREEPPG
jgi:ParB-like chromosome segregation protein Spo0J